ncbi:hypothetical protein PVAP13_4KG294015 [Panicum virgatum]|uniref:Uncharacterized protein n=1 Tax=Panicum virgatum TaxID=38727 RepID=A0A8T0TKR7_PANVG|nr:hypothetical protein PVAP13_4KG294015 [Panicum virgatum]
MYRSLQRKVLSYLYLLPEEVIEQLDAPATHTQGTPITRDTT